MRSRPYVDLKLPSAAQPGSPLRIGVHLEATSRTPVDFIDVDIQGRERVRDAEQARSNYRTILSHKIRIAEDITLEEGKHTFEAVYTLPEDIPFSYTGYLSEIQYSVGAEVSIPWWLDANERMDLSVAPQPIARPARFPLIVSKENTIEPFIEFVLDDRYFSPGEEISGALALGNVRDRRVEGVDVSLVGKETLRFPEEFIYEAHRTTLCLKAGSSDEGKEIGFRLRIPKNVSPSFDAGSIMVTWFLEIRIQLAGILSGPGRSVPIVIGAYSAPQSTPAPRRTVGSARWQKIWEECAARAGFSLDPDELKISGSVHGSELSAWIDSSAEQSSRILGELRWPSWGLGLSLHPEGFAQQLFGSAEDRVGHYRIEGRHLPQCRPAFTEELRTALLVFDSIEMDDIHALVGMRGPIFDSDFLMKFLGLLEALAKAVQLAEGNIPPPPSIADKADELRAFARELNCRVIPGSLSIVGAQFEGAKFHMETQFNEEGQPSLFRITLRAEESAGKGFDSNESKTLSPLIPAVREIVGSLSADGRQVRASKKRFELDIPLPIAPVPKLKEFMRAMIVLEHRLRGERRGGPYR